MRGPDDVKKLIGKKLRAEAREHFLVLLLNARHECLAVETVRIGSLNASIVHPREVFRPAGSGGEDDWSLRNQAR